MICLIAFIVFGILGIFSARHRIIAKEAMDCVFRRVTLRKCDTGLDKRLKNQITGKLGRNHPRTAKFLFKYFEVFSWIMIILLVWSLWGMGVGAYNYAVYGSCVKPGESGVCVFNLQESVNQYSNIRADYPEEVVYPDVSSPSIGTGEQLIMFGCYTCPYTTQAWKEVTKLVDDYSYKVEFVFVDFPILSHKGAMELAKQAHCADEQGKYYAARLKIYDNQYTYLGNDLLANELGMNIESFTSCIESEETEQAILENIELGINAHVSGTPTFFFRGEKIEGARSVQTLREMIE